MGKKREEAERSTSTVEGRETVRALGDLWILAEPIAGMPGLDGDMETAPTCCHASLDGRHGYHKPSLVYLSWEKQ